MEHLPWSWFCIGAIVGDRSVGRLLQHVQIRAFKLNLLAMLVLTLVSCLPLLFRNESASP